MTITEMRELKEQSSRSAGSISGKEAGGIYIRGLLCPALSDSRRSSRTLYRLSDRQPRDRCHAARYHFWFPCNPDRCNRHMDAWKSSPRQGRKAEKAFHLAVPSAAYPGKRRDYPACVKIRLRHPSDVVFRDYRNGRGNHFLRYLRTDSVGCAEKIQKPVVPRLNCKNTKKVSSSCFLEVTIPFFFTCNRMHALRAFYCHEYAINRFPFSSNMLRASFMPFL